MARRRHRRKFTWLPTQGTTGLDETQIANSAIFTTIGVIQNPDVLGPIGSVEFPLLNDFPQEPYNGNEGSTTEGIGEIIGNDYFVERIVGKIFVGATALNATSGNATLLVKAGIFVARADSADPNQPIGLTAANYSPLALENVREPWMFQRTWLLSGGVAQNGNPFSVSTAGLTNRQLQTNHGFNAGANVEEGPHIDVRSVRRVRQDERLFITFSAQGYNPTGDATTIQDATVRILADLRVLGALRKASQRSSF